MASWVYNMESEAERAELLSKIKADGSRKIPFGIDLTLDGMTLRLEENGTLYASPSAFVNFMLYASQRAREAQRNAVKLN